MAAPKRFAVSTLLLVMLLVSLVFGYAQWRRQWLRREVDRLKSEGVEMAGMTDDWFWPRTARRAAITFMCEGPTLYSHQGVKLTSDEARQLFTSLASQARELGVGEVSYCITRNDEEGGGITEMSDLDSLEYETRKLYEWLQ